MKKGKPPASPDAYVAALDSWRLRLVTTLREGDAVEPATVRRLTKEAVALNRQLGDPTAVARRTSTPAKGGRRGKGVSG